MSIARLDAIEAALSTAGLAGTSAWPLRVMNLPATPDQVVVVYPTGGPEPEAGKDRPTFQVVVRGRPGDVDGPYIHADLIRRQMHLAVVSGLSLFVATQSAPASQGLDSRDRNLWGVNFRGHEA